MVESFSALILFIGDCGDMAGVAIIALGVTWMALRFVFGLAQGDAGAYSQFRAGIGRTLLLGLEVLVAADVIRTVAVTPTFQSVLILGMIVLIRTFMSWTLQLELEGRWPWQSSPGTPSQT
jgi:uncharacterized membrane protein